MKTETTESPRMLIVCAVILSTLAFGRAAQAQSGLGSPRTFKEWQIPTPNSDTLDVFFNSPLAFFAERASSKVAQLQVGTNIFTEWTLPAGSAPHEIVQQFGSTFFTEESGAIGLLNSSANTATIWAVPTPNSTPTRIVLTGFNPTAFFIESTGNKIAFLNGTANQITEWLIPTPNSTPVAIAAGATNQIWFAETNKIGMLNTSTNAISEWTIPSVSRLSGMKFFQGGVYFADFGSGVIGRLKNNVITEWTAPTSPVEIGDVAVGIAFVGVMNTSTPIVYFTEFAANNIGSLDSTQAGTNTTVTPVVTSVTPAIASVTPITMTLPQVKTTVTPVTTTVNGTASGAFWEMPVPTPQSGPLGVVAAKNGVPNVIFAENSGNKICSVK